MLHIQEEASRCLLCADAPCAKVCKNGDPARAIRSIRFGKKACIHYDRPIRIRELVRSVCSDTAVKNVPPPSLDISFCGIHCENPFFLASSAICTNYDMVARAFDMGWAGVFYKTICMQEIKEVSPRFDAVQEGGRSDFSGFRNMEQLSENPYEVDFDILRRAV